MNLPVAILVDFFIMNQSIIQADTIRALYRLITIRALYRPIQSEHCTGRYNQSIIQADTIRALYRPIQSEHYTG
jgi:hypothetical protein